MIRVLTLLLALIAGMSGQFAPPNPTPVVAVQAAPVKSPADALKKFAACVAPNPEVNVTLPIAREVLAKLAADGFDVSGGLWCNETRGGAVVARAVSEADLVGAGWPESAPLNLTIPGTTNSHSVAAIKKQMDYGWGYWWFAKRWVSFWW